MIRRTFTVIRRSEPIQWPGLMGWLKPLLPLRMAAGEGFGL